LHIAFATLPFLGSGLCADKANTSKAALEKSATHIVVGKVQAIYSSVVQEGDYEITNYVAEVKIDKLVKGEGPEDLIYVRYFSLDWKGAGNPPPGPGGHDQPKLGKTHRFYLARNAYDGYHLAADNNDGGYNIFYRNGAQSVQLRDWKEHLGERVTLTGTAINHKVGAYLAGDGFGISVDLPGTHWPSELYHGGDKSELVRVTGTITEVADLPVFIADSNTPPVQSIPVPEGTDLEQARKRFILKSVEWTRIENQPVEVPTAK